MPGVCKRPVDVRIYSLMKRQGVPHFAALALKIHRPRMTVGRILGGGAKLKPLAAHAKLAETLGVSLEDLAHILLDLGYGQRINRRDALLQERGISIRGLAKKMSLDPSNIHSIFDRSNQHLQLRVCRDISRGLACTLDELSNILFTTEVLHSDGPPITITHMTEFQNVITTGC